MITIDFRYAQTKEKKEEFNINKIKKHQWFFFEKTSINPRKKIFSKRLL